MRTRTIIANINTKKMKHSVKVLNELPEDVMAFMNGNVDAFSNVEYEGIRWNLSVFVKRNGILVEHQIKDFDQGFNLGIFAPMIGAESFDVLLAVIRGTVNMVCHKYPYSRPKFLFNGYFIGFVNDLPVPCEN